MVTLPLWLDEANQRLNDILDGCWKISKVLTAFLTLAGEVSGSECYDSLCHCAQSYRAGPGNASPSFQELRVSLPGQMRNNLVEFARHHLRHISREKCEKYRDTRGCEWAIISS